MTEQERKQIEAELKAKGDKAIGGLEDSLKSLKETILQTSKISEKITNELKK